MATNNNIIKSLTPTNYVGVLQGDGIRGSINVNADKQLVQINCIVEGLGTFEANGGPAAVNEPTLHPQGWDKAAALGTRAKEIVDTVIAELEEI